jgi:hypothetical protein
MLQAYVSCCKHIFQVLQLFSDVCFKCFICLLKNIWMLHNMHVSSVCFKCFRCFIRMFQVFHLDVAKVDLDAAYVAMAIHACFKRTFYLFHTYVASVSSMFQK